MKDMKDRHPKIQNIFKRSMKVVKDKRLLIQLLIQTLI